MPLLDIAKTLSYNVVMNDRNYMSQYMSDKYYKRHRECLDYLGSKCVVCGTGENLEFDHIDRKTKLFTITTRLDSAPEQEIFEELNKCQLLCQDHHKEKTVSENSVDHGEGATGKRNCYCELCKPLKQEYNKQFKRKKRKSGRTLSKADPEHGERRRYTGRWKCRCDLCRKAQSEYMKQYR